MRFQSYKQETTTLTAIILNICSEAKRDSNAGRKMIAITTPDNNNKPQWHVPLTGIGVRLATGYMDISGGFLIVPSLIFAVGLAI